MSGLSRRRFDSHEEVALFEVCSGNLRRKRVPRGATLRDLEYFLLQKNEGRRFPVFLLYDSVKETWETVNDRSMKLSFGMSLPPEEENENENASRTAPAATISSRGEERNEIESLSWSRTMYQERDGEWSRLKQPPGQLSEGPRGAAEPGLLERNKIMVESLRKAGLPYCGVSSAQNEKENAGLRLIPETGARGTASGGTGSPRPVDATTACASSPSPRQEPTTEEHHDEEPAVLRHGEAREPVTTNAALSVEKKELAAKSKSSTASTGPTGFGSGTPPGHTNAEMSAALSGSSLLNLDNVATLRRATSCGGDSSCSSDLKEKEYGGGSSAASTVCSRAGCRRLSSSAFGSEGSNGTWGSLPSVARSRGSASSLPGAAARTLTDNSMSLVSLLSGSSGDETGRAFSKNGSEAGGSSVASFSHISQDSQEPLIRPGRGSVSCINPSCPSKHKVEDMVSNLQMPVAAPEATAVSNSKLPPAGSGVNSTTSSALMYFPPSEDFSPARRERTRMAEMPFSPVGARKESKKKVFYWGVLWKEVPTNWHVFAHRFANFGELFSTSADLQGEAALMTDHGRSSQTQLQARAAVASRGTGGRSRSDGGGRALASSSARSRLFELYRDGHDAFSFPLPFVRLLRNGTHPAAAPASTRPASQSPSLGRISSVAASTIELSKFRCAHQLRLTGTVRLACAPFLLAQLFTGLDYIWPAVPRPVRRLFRPPAALADAIPSTSLYVPLPDMTAADSSEEQQEDTVRQGSDNEWSSEGKSDSDIAVEAASSRGVELVDTGRAEREAVSDGSNSTPSKEKSRSLLKRTTDAALYTCRAAARVSKALPRVGSSSLASGFPVCKKGDAPSSRRGIFSRGGKRVAPEPDASGNLTPETSSDSKRKGAKPSSSASGLQPDPIIPAAQPPTLAQGGLTDASRSLNPEPGEHDAAADELLRRLHALSLDNADEEHSVAGETAAQPGLPAGFGLTSANSVRAPLQGDFPDDHMTRRQNKTSTTPDDCSIDATLGDPFRSPSRQDSLKSKDSSSNVSLAEGGEPPLPVALPGVPLSPPEQSRLSTGDDSPEEQGEMVAPPGDEGPTPRVVAGTAAGAPVHRDGGEPAGGRGCHQTKKKKKKKADLRAPLQYEEFPVRRFATLYAGWVLESLGPSGAFLEMLAEVHNGAQRAYGRVQRQPREPPYHLLGYREEGLDFLDPPGRWMHHRDYGGWIDDELPSDQMMRRQPPARSTGSAGPLPSSAASLTFPPTKSAANYFSATPAPASFVSRSSWELPPQQSFVRDVGASYWRRSLEKYEGFRREVDKWTWSVFNLRHARVAAKALHADELVPTERDLTTERQRAVDAAATAAGGVGVPPDAAAGVFHRGPMRPERGFHEDEEADAAGRPAAVVARAAERPRDEAAGGGGTAEEQEAAMPDGGGDGTGNGDGRVYQPGLGTWTTPAGDQAQPAKNPLAHTLQTGGETLKDWAKRVWTADRGLAQVLFDGCKEEPRASSSGAASRVDTLLEMLGVDEDERDFLAARAAAILADDSDNEDDAAIYRDRLLYEDPAAADLAPPPQNPNLFGRNLDEEEDRGGSLGAGNREAGTEPTGNRPHRQESRRTTPTSSFGGGRAKSKGSRFSSEGEPSVDFSECRLRRHLFPEGPLEPHFTTHARPPERPGDPDPAEYREGLLPMRGTRGQRFLFDADFFGGSSGAQGDRAGAGRARGFTREADLDDRTELRELDLRFHVIQPFFGVDVVTHRINMRWQVLMTLGEGRRATPPFPAGGKVMRLELNIHHYVTRSDIRLRLRPDRAPDYVISLGANEPVSLMFY
eukprot:g15300.t1